MTVLAETEAVMVGLVGGCTDRTCLQLADGLLDKLDTDQYRNGVSLMAVPESLEAWLSEHRTARKRATRSGRLGYRFDEIDRSLFTDDIFEINTSLEMRQGQPMRAGYLTRTVHGKLPVYPCPLHNIRTYGVLQGDVLRAYLSLYRVGELALISMILGHGDHLRNDIMYLLFAGVVDSQAGLGGFFYYNRHDSGTDGLRYYKERVGFRPQRVTWAA